MHEKYSLMVRRLAECGAILAFQAAAECFTKGAGTAWTIHTTAFPLRHAT